MMSSSAPEPADGTFGLEAVNVVQATRREVTWDHAELRLLDVAGRTVRARAARNARRVAVKITSLSAGYYVAALRVNGSVRKTRTLFIAR